MNTNMPLLVFGLDPPTNILRVLKGEAIGTYVGTDV
jgi:uridylate kinase